MSHSKFTVNKVENMIARAGMNEFSLGSWHLCIEVVSKSWENYCEPGWYPRNLWHQYLFPCPILFLSHSPITFPCDRAQSISFLLRSPFQYLSLAYHIPAGSGSFILWALIELLSYLHRSMSCFSIRVAVFHTHGSPPPTKWWAHNNKACYCWHSRPAFLIAVKVT